MKIGREPGRNGDLMAGMRIFYVCDVYFHADTRKTHVAEIVHNLQRQHEVVALVPVSPGSGETVEGLTYLGVGEVPFLSMYLFQCRLFIHGILNYGRNGPAFIYTRLSGYTIAPFLLARLWRVPYFVELNSQIAMEAALGGYSWLPVTVIRWIERLNCRTADRSFRNVIRERRRLAAGYRENGFRGHNPMFSPDISPDP